jgi:hypothetical protein
MDLIDRSPQSFVRNIGGLVTVTSVSATIIKKSAAQAGNQGVSS